MWNQKGIAHLLPLLALAGVIAIAGYLLRYDLELFVLDHFSSANDTAPANIQEAVE